MMLESPALFAEPSLAQTGPARSVGSTAFQNIRQAAAPALAALVATLMLLGLVDALKSPPPAASGPGADASLYRHVVQRLEHGEDYYASAASELRSHDYPLRPFLAVRPPLLAVGLSILPGEAARRGALALLAGFTFLAWAWRLRGHARRPLGYALSLTVLASGVAPALAPPAHLFHEVWAGLLVALSLALRRPGAWTGSLAIGLLAALLRELAAPYLAVMALLAWTERRRGEACAWGLALAVFALALTVHAHAVGAATSSADPASPGWLGLDGWRGALRTARWNAMILAGPAWFGALVYPAALAGLLAWPGELGRRLAFLGLGYAAGFSVFGRPDNSYWGLVIAPLWPLGLVSASRAWLALKAAMAPARLDAG